MALVNDIRDTCGNTAKTGRRAERGMRGGGHDSTVDAKEKVMNKGIQVVNKQADSGLLHC